MPRKLLLSMQTSLDGFVGSPDGNVDWAFPHFDDEFQRAQVAMLGGAGVHLMGRRLYHDMAAHWPTSTEPYAPPMNDIPKVVFSKTLKDPEWQGTTVVTGDLATEIARLKQQDGGYLLAHGGASFARSLSFLGLVDTYRLIVHPTVLGTGLPIFAEQAELKLTNVERFPAGAVALTYVPAG